MKDIDQRLIDYDENYKIDHAEDMRWEHVAGNSDECITVPTNVNGRLFLVSTPD